MANTLLIWEKTPFASEFAEQLGIVEEDDIIQSLDDLKDQALYNKDCIYLLLETTIDGKQRQELDGINILRHLRKDRQYRRPIFVFTTYPSAFINAKKEAHILYTSGVFLLPLTMDGPFLREIEAVIEGFTPLSDALLEDVIHSVFNAGDRIHELLHNMKNELNSNHLSMEIVVSGSPFEPVFEKYEPLLKREIEMRYRKEFETLFLDLKKKIRDDFKERSSGAEEGEMQVSYLNAGASISLFSNQILALAISNDDDDLMADKEDVAWEAIFLDDNTNIREIVREYFLARKVICHPATCKQDVIGLLKQHGAKIALFVCDIRLLNEDGHWYDQQGYDIIGELANSGGFPLTYAILTSKKGAITRMVRQRRPYQISWFSKDDVIDSKQSFNVFFDIVARSAEDMHLSNTVFQPNQKRWFEAYPKHFRFPFKDYFKMHKESIEYRVEEPLLNRHAIAFLNGELHRDRWDWEGKLNNRIITDQELTKFRQTKLLGRRIVLAYVASGKLISGNDIYRRMMNAETKHLKGSTVRQFFLKLALPTQSADLIEDAIKYARDGIKPPAMLQEEYDFLLAEYIEEQINYSLELGDERQTFLNLLQHLKGVMKSKDITEPQIFNRVMDLVKNDYEPRVERLNQMFTALESLVTDSNSLLFKTPAIRAVVVQFKNTHVCEALKKIEWI